MRELGGFALEMLLAFLSVGLQSMTGIISVISLFAALQFCGLRCESRVLARIYCPPILLHRPTSALCPSSLCCKCLLPGPRCSIFLPFPCYHYHFFLLSALHSKCFIFLSLLECQKKQRQILPALWLTPQVGRYFLTTTLSIFCHIIEPSLLGNDLPSVLPAKCYGNESTVNKLQADQHTFLSII